MKLYNWWGFNKCSTDQWISTAVTTLLSGLGRGVFIEFNRKNKMANYQVTTEFVHTVENEDQLETKTLVSSLHRNYNLLQSTSCISQ